MSPPNLLTIPREIRQRILKYTRPDYDLRVDCKPAFICWKFVPQYTHKETSRWVRDLCLVNSEIARDMVWVQGQKAEKQRATERKKAALKERHPLFEEEVTFGYSRVLSWVACFARQPEGWEKLLHLGYTGWLTGDRLMIIRREGFNDISNRSARSHWVVSLA
ncbi:hypothetical protein E6O75_ATG04378 [Venturia nashicola]|uniref:Uncharacterized protein n=1 Tax=Venturia nashicola TaxID=86259 RepID=A0A4Z1P7Q6_9PEZI|nr:hypothetical protein E6O75_ATG04378 [Venturia nashicola]